MESQNGLGIYISKKTATAVYLNPRAKDGTGIECFSVAVEEGEERDQSNMQILAELIARDCAERNWKRNEISVALDCALFMQHSVHSEFRDPKKIAATVKFDTEETLATDISHVALAFEIASSDENGSDVTVFTAERRILSDTLSALQQHHLDPITMEPDVVCLTRLIHKKLISDDSEQEVMFALLSRHCGYLIIPASSGDGSRKAPVVRTFLLGANQDRTQVLTREILVTMALAQETESPRVLKVFDTTGIVKPYLLRDKLSMDVDNIDLYQSEGTSTPDTDIDVNPLDRAIAYGAALTHSEKGHKVDFRNDFSPFLGRRLKLKNALKFAAVSVTVLLIAVGLFFQTQLFNINKDKNKLRHRFVRDYGDVTLERLSDNVSFKKAVSNLGSLLRRIKAEKMGLEPGQKSISSNMTLALSAFNTRAAQTDLNISSLTVTDELITVQADVSSRQNRLTLFEAVEKGGLDIVRQDYTSSGGRESFNITLKPTAK